jgi:hypothetical protein
VIDLAGKFGKMTDEFGQVSKAMVKELVLFALLGSAFTFGVTWLFVSDRGMAWIASLAVGAVVILFDFSEPAEARTIGDIAGNLALIMQKTIYGIVWLAASFGVSPGLPPAWRLNLGGEKMWKPIRKSSCGSSPSKWAQQLVQEFV